MNTKKILVVSLFVLFFLAGCGNSHPAGPAPIAVSIAPQNNFQTDQAKTAAVTATVNDSQGVSWTLTQGGAACSPGCGTLASQNTLTGVANTYNAPAAVPANPAVLITATSVKDTTKSAAVTVTVTPPPANIPNPPPPPVGTVGQPYELMLMNYAQGGAQPFDWEIQTGTLPQGLSITDHAMGIVSGTPTASTSAGRGRSTSAKMLPFSVGTVTVTFICTDASGLTVTVTITFTVNNPPVAITSSTTLPPGTNGQAYPNTQLNATGGKPPYTWAVIGGAFPTGMGISSAGVISGTPTQSGSFSIMIQVTAADPGTATATFSLTIAQPGVLTITNGNPPDGTQNVQYGGSASGFALTASGGITPLNWTESGTLPTGMQVISNTDNTGSLEGTPTNTGSFTFTVTVTDSATTPNTASKTYTINITVQTTCTPGQQVLCGQFDILSQGQVGSGDQPVMIAVDFTATLAGTPPGPTITSGVIELNNVTGFTSSPINAASSTIGFVGAAQPGVGVLTLVPTNPLTGGPSAITFTFALNSGGTFAYLYESDDAVGTGLHDSGFMQVVDKTAFSQAAVAGGWALGMIGGDASATRGRAGLEAAVTASAAGCGLNATSAFFIHQVGTSNSTPVPFTCSGLGLGLIDATVGEGAITISTPAGFFSAPTLNFDFFIVNANKMIFISRDTAGANLPIMSGTMFRQNPAKVGAFAAGDLACGFTGDANKACIFAISGETGTPGTTVIAGRALGPSLGNLNIIEDVDHSGNPTKSGTNVALTFTVSVLADGTAILIPGSATNSPAAIILIDTDTGIVGVDDGNEAIGFVKPQTALAPASGSYIAGTQFVANGPEPNAAGNLAVTAPAANPGTISGTVNLEQGVIPPPVPTELSGNFGGTFRMDAPATGRGTGTTGTGSLGPSQFSVFVVSSNEIVVVETDTGTSANPDPVIIDLQLQ